MKGKVSKLTYPMLPHYLTLLYTVNQLLLVATLFRDQLSINWFTMTNVYDQALSRPVLSTTRPSRTSRKFLAHDLKLDYSAYDLLHSRGTSGEFPFSVDNFFSQYCRINEITILFIQHCVANAHVVINN